MNLSALQLYCLKEMQIPIWQYQRCRFFVYLEEERQSYSEAERTLLSKILQAIKWPESAVEYKKIPVNNSLNEIINVEQAILIFSDHLINEIMHPKTVIIPSLSSMLKQPKLKKQAWQKMQVFLHLPFL